MSRIPIDVRLRIGAEILRPLLLVGLAEGHFKMATPKQVSHRSSKTGEFVTEKFAKQHPATTEREVIKHPTPTKSKT